MPPITSHQSHLTSHGEILLALIQLVDPVNQIVIAGCISHDLVQLEQPFIFRSVVESHPRLGRVMPEHNFVPMDRLYL